MPHGAITTLQPACSSAHWSRIHGRPATDLPKGPAQARGSHLQSPLSQTRGGSTTSYPDVPFSYHHIPHLGRVQEWPRPTAQGLGSNLKPGAAKHLWPRVTRRKVSYDSDVLLSWFSFQAQGKPPSPPVICEEVVQARHCGSPKAGTSVSTHRPLRAKSFILTFCLAVMIDSERVNSGRYGRPVDPSPALLSGSILCN